MLGDGTSASSVLEVDAVVVISTKASDDVSYFSYAPVELLYLIMPPTPDGCCPDVPEGSVSAPVMPDNISCVSVAVMLLCVI